MVDDELSAALQVHYKVHFDHRYEEARRRGEAVPSPRQRFLVGVGAERGPELWAKITALESEARTVPDPGGPLSDFADALEAWAATHPEIERREMHWITTTLLREHG